MITDRMEGAVSVPCNAFTLATPRDLRLSRPRPITPNASACPESTSYSATSFYFSAGLP